MEEFEVWLRAGGAIFDDVRIGGVKGGLGVYTTRRFREGEVIFSVPRKLCLEVPLLEDAIGGQGVFSQAGNPLEQDVLNCVLGRESLVAAASGLLRERRAGPVSNYAPYIALLPDPPPLHPLAEQWPKGFAEKSPLLERFHRTVSVRDDACVEKLSQEPVWKRRKWALGAVWTRAFELEAPQGDGKMLAMVPLADLVNHWTPHSRDDRGWSCRFDEGPEDVTMIAERDVSKGEELSQLYDEKSDAILLCQYGIPTLPGLNVSNRAPLVVPSAAVCLPLEPDGVAEPALISARAAALSRHGWDLRVPLIFAVPQATDPEGGLLALARILALPSPEEVEANEHLVFWMEGQTAEAPRLEPAVERRAWGIIAAWERAALTDVTSAAAAFFNAADGAEARGESAQLTSALAAALAGEVMALEAALDEATRRSEPPRRPRSLRQRWRRRETEGSEGDEEHVVEA